ncbi:MAG: hypothetical protein HYS06_05590 [Methylocystis sp.]|nr:hypothetical protein [Methylocystis sp.]
MSQSGSSEKILFLRRAIAAIEARGGQGNARYGRIGYGRLNERPRRFGSVSRDPFERLLDEGAVGGMSEIVPARPGDEAAAAGFAFALALRRLSMRPRSGVVWIAEDMVAREIGLPYAKGLEAAGVDPERLVLVRTRRPRETLWAMEETLKSKAVAAVVAETWIAPGAYGLEASRRLVVAARRGAGAGLLLLAKAAGEAARFTSAAPTRFEVASSVVQRAGADAFARARRLPSPGPPAWRARIVKARAGPFGAGADCDPSCWRDLVFDPDKALLRYALPLRFPAALGDRPDSSPAAQRLCGGRRSV